MIIDTTNIDQQGLKLAYRENAYLCTILDHFASQTNNQWTTIVTSLSSSLSKKGISRNNIIKTFKTLADLGCGTFITGRRGGESRFQWHVSSKDLGRFAAGENAAVGSSQSADGDVDANKAILNQIDHKYQLRPDVKTTFLLPCDLTAVEAERLATFIRSLPFEDPQLRAD